eukprot:GGOE01064001.1.p1 GENE.GGOE01064001.1~~GGOE01064001.1.p1  ORF type:complete len:111 (-),score=15.46 GGOE01064001.1:130-417(-)
MWDGGIPQANGWTLGFLLRHVEKGDSLLAKELNGTSEFANGRLIPSAHPISGGDAIYRGRWVLSTCSRQTAVTWGSHAARHQKQKGERAVRHHQL